MSVHRSNSLLAALALVILAFGTSTAAGATPGEVTSFEGPNCYRVGIAAAPGGGVWVRRCSGRYHNAGTALANITSSGSTVSRPIAESLGGPFAVGPAGELWLASKKPESEDAWQIERVGPEGGVSDFSFPGAINPIQFNGLALGVEGALWATVGEPGILGPGPISGPGRLVRVDADGTQAEFPIPGEIEPQGIALGPDGNLWFTGVHGRYSGEHSSSPGIGYVGRMTPTGAISLFRTPIKSAEPGAIVAVPDGRLWFAESGPDRIGTIATDGAFGRE
jgi:virginiamycin B lyase